MNDRRSHWPMYKAVPIELINIVSEAVRRATAANKDGMVVYFPSQDMRVKNLRKEE